jgi:uncharacterized peroxidase-related enzyme
MTGSELEKLLAALTGDHGVANLGRADRAMLDYAVKMTRQPEQITADDIEALRAEGFDDRGVHDICAVTAYFAFVNRIADGLGVEIEPSRTNSDS